VTRWLASAGLATATALLIAPGARAFDCSKAATGVERAICAEPDLKSSDDAMEAAYRRLRDSLGAEARAMLAAAQKQWIAEREGCASDPDSIPACIERETRQRARLLQGKAESGPGAGVLLEAEFRFRDASAGRYALDATLLRFTDPETAGQQRLNELADALHNALPDRVPTDAMNPETYYFSTRMRLTYAGPDLLSVAVTFSSYDGGAHGATSTQHANILADGSFLAADAVFSAKTQATIANECRGQIAALKSRRAADAGGSYDPAEDVGLNSGAVESHVAASEYWGLTDERLLIDFDPYEVGYYAEGPFQCSFALRDLRAMALPGAPLP